MDKTVLQALVRCPLFFGMSETEIDIALAGVSYKLVNYDRHDIYALTGMPLKSADIVIRGILVCRMS